jgi:hypothetical protein
MADAMGRGAEKGVVLLGRSWRFLKTCTCYFLKVLGVLESHSVFTLRSKNCFTLFHCSLVSIPMKEKNESNRRPLSRRPCQDTYWRSVWFATQVVVFAEETLADIRQIADKHAQRTAQRVADADSYDDAATELQLVVRFIAAPVLSMGLKQPCLSY